MLLERIPRNRKRNDGRHDDVCVARESRTDFNLRKFAITVNYRLSLSFFPNFSMKHCKNELQSSEHYNDTIYNRSVHSKLIISVCHIVAYRELS